MCILDSLENQGLNSHIWLVLLHETSQSRRWTLWPHSLCIHRARLVTDTREALVSACGMNKMVNRNNFIRHASILVYQGCCNEEPQTTGTSQFWKLEGQDQGVGRIGFSWGCEGVWSLRPNFWWLAGNLWCSLATSHLHVYKTFSCMCVSPNLPPL